MFAAIEDFCVATSASQGSLCPSVTWSLLANTTEVLGAENPLSWGDNIWRLTDTKCCANPKVKISLHTLCSTLVVQATLAGLEKLKTSLEESLEQGN